MEKLNTYPWFKYASIFLLGIAIGWLMHRPAPVPMVEVPDATPPSIQQGMAAVGLPVSKPEATAISKEIDRRVKDTKPDYEATFPTMKAADKKINEVAKADGADAVLKEIEKPKDYGIGKDIGKDIGTKLPTAPVQAKYYGIHYEPKNAIGVYADIDKDGSYGIHVRKDRVALDVGKKYKDGSITSRVIWEAIKIK